MYNNTKDVKNKMINENEIIEKSSFTEVFPAPKKLPTDNASKSTEKQKAPLLNVSLNTSKDGVICSSQKDFLGNESFSFEKSKLQQLKIESTPPMDINDESIAKLKNEIFRKFQNVLVSFERISNIIRILSVSLLFVEILEMIGIFFMLLYLSLKMVPSEYILFWVGSSLIFSLMEMFLLIKSIIASQSKEVKTHKEYVYIGIGFILLLTLYIVVCLRAVLLGEDVIGITIREDVRNTLKYAQKLLIIPIIEKLSFQVAFLILESFQLKNIKIMGGLNPPSTEPNSRNYMLGN